MPTPRLNLVVLRVADLERAATFYRTLGLTFVRHAHGSGPEHYASEDHDLVFELYAATDKQPVTSSTRVGFVVANLDDVVTQLSAIDGTSIVAAPRDSEWGRRAVVADPDGHRVELLKA